MLKPEIGKTYIMTTSKSATIIFRFINIGEYEVNGEIINVGSHTDLAKLDSIVNIDEYKKP